MKYLPLILLVAVSVVAQAYTPPPDTSVHWIAYPVDAAFVATWGANDATIRVNEPDAEMIQISHYAGGGSVYIPPTPFTVTIYPSLWEALEPYAKLRARGKDAWVVTFSDHTAAVVKRL